MVPTKIRRKNRSGGLNAQQKAQERPFINSHGIRSQEHRDTRPANMKETEYVTGCQQCVSIHDNSVNIQRMPKEVKSKEGEAGYNGAGVGRNEWVVAKCKRRRKE